ncbi:hypothetical protein [Nocardia abscessus]|nr:hypothetical protein [Nocardia abscessus]
MNTDPLGAGLVATLTRAPPRPAPVSVPDGIAGLAIPGGVR